MTQFVLSCFTTRLNDTSALFVKQIVS